MPAAAVSAQQHTAAPPSPPLSDQPTLEDVVRDPHMHSLFLQYLSSHDKKGFARLLFLVSVDEFKKLLGANESALRRGSSSQNNSLRESAGELRPSDDDDDGDEDGDGDARSYRQAYASKIIAKFMSKDSFLDIASENLKILNKSVWSFGSFLRHDLMMCAGLSSKVDLFLDAEIAVRKALQPSFEQFARTSEFAELLRNARLTYALVADDEGAAGADDAALPQAAQAAQTSGPPSVSKATSILTIERVLRNRRLCSVFWVFLFKERTHEQLSLWMDLRDHLLPLLEAFIAAANADLDDEEDVGDDIYAYHDEDVESDINGSVALTHQRATADADDDARAVRVEQQQQRAGELIEQILTVGGRIAGKYLAADASASVTFVGEAERALLSEYERRVASCMEAGSFSLADAEVLLATVERISGVIEENLKVNHFVRFMGSESFKALVACYQSRLLSPSGLLRSGESPAGGESLATELAPESSASSSASSSDASATTTLHELFQCMSVASHQPQRARGKTFTLRDLLQAQIRGEAPGRALVSSVIAFRLDTRDKAAPRVVKRVLHAPAGAGADGEHHHALPDHVEAFFCPAGAALVRATSRPAPRLFHMTIGTADRAFYGACLTRFVARSDASQLGPLEQVLRETDGLEVYEPVGLCLISRYPILDTLKRRLNALHVGLRADAEYLANADWAPSRAELAELLAPFDFTRVAAGGAAAALPSLATFVDFSMEELFHCLSPENAVAVVTALLLERQVVLLSSRYSVLTCVGETLKSLLAPLEWSHVFAPILPKSMLEALQCPTPYLFGAHASYRPELLEMLAREGSGDAIVLVDLDADVLRAGALPRLPDALRAPLVAGLEQLLKPRVFFSDLVPMCAPASPRARAFPERRVRLCFRRAVAQLLARLDDFRFVLSDDVDYAVVFDRAAFLARVPPSELAFFRAFLDTQLFSHEIASVA